MSTIPSLLSKKKIQTLPAAIARPARDIIRDSLNLTLGDTWKTHIGRVQANACMVAPTADL